MSVSAPSPAISFDRVSKRYAGGHAVLEDITSAVGPGEFVSVLGPSGCGKSTLLRLVAGLSPLSSGAILIDGVPPVAARESLSFIFQDPTLLPWRTVQANVGLGLELAGVRRDERHARVDALLALVGLSAVGESYPRQLSGGMKMRVSIARALAGSPRMLLLDEPFGALDEITRDHMNEELLRLHREHRWTVLFVTHSVAEAVFLSTRILILAHPGRIAHDVAIDLAAERTSEIRASERYEQLVAQTSRSLRELHREPPP